MHSFALKKIKLLNIEVTGGLIYFTIILCIAFEESNSTDHSTILSFPLTEFKLMKEKIFSL